MPFAFLLCGTLAFSMRGFVCIMCVLSLWLCWLPDDWLLATKAHTRWWYYIRVYGRKYAHLQIACATLLIPFVLHMHSGPKSVYSFSRILPSYCIHRQHVQVIRTYIFHPTIDTKNVRCTFIQPHIPNAQKYLFASEHF